MGKLSYAKQIHITEGHDEFILFSRVMEHEESFIKNVCGDLGCEKPATYDLDVDHVWVYNEETGKNARLNLHTGDYVPWLESSQEWVWFMIEEFPTAIFYLDKLFPEEELRKPEDWCTILGAEILDHDGWRDGTREWEEPITKTEFDERLLRCTIDALKYPTFYKSGS